MSYNTAGSWSWNIYIASQISGIFIGSSSLCSSGKGPPSSFFSSFYGLYKLDTLFYGKPGYESILTPVL